MRCKWDPRSSEILRSVEWKFRTDVSWKPICPIFKCQAVQEEELLGLLEDGTQGLFQNIGKESPLYAA